MIDIFIGGLPLELGKKLTGEYNRRKQEAKYLLKNYSYANISLKDDLDTIEYLLSLSVFHRRIIANIESANSFTNFIFSNSEAESIGIGSYNLDVNEKKTVVCGCE